MKEKFCIYKQHLNNIKSEMLGSDFLDIHESFKQKIKQLDDELKQLTDPAPLFGLFLSVIFEFCLFFSSPGPDNRGS